MRMERGSKRRRVPAWVLVPVLAVGLVGIAAAQFLEPDVEVLATYGAEMAGDSFGFVGEAIGDLDGDGASEYLIGAPFNLEGGAQAGKAYLYDGRSGALLQTFVGVSPDRLGWATGEAGDVNNDGVPDYCLGGPGPFGAPPPNAGRVLVISGADHSVIHDLSGSNGSSYGYECNAAGDVDDDEHDDVIVGAIFDSTSQSFGGRVHLVSGKTGDDIWTRDGATAFAFFGSGVDSVGDIDGDGVRDQVIGALGGGPSGTGIAVVVSGVDGSTLLDLAPVGTAGSFGWFFAHDAGDVNNDDVPDIYVGDFSDTELGPGSGRAYVFSGADGSILLDIGAENAGDGLGMGRAAGDLDDDEHDDLLLGAFTNGDAAVQGGKAYLRSGRTGEILRTFTGTTAIGQVGFDTVALGDVNDDELPDYLLTGLDLAFVVAGTDLEDDDSDDDDSSD